MTTQSSKRGTWNAEGRRIEVSVCPSGVRSSGMRRFRRGQGFGSRRALGFTVVELMVAISVMTLIVLVLYGLFDQTQRAMRGNVSQVDVLEGGRAAMDMIATDMEQMRASNVRSATNLFVQLILPQTVQALPGAE